MAHASLSDPDFDRTITLRDAYKLMEAFLTQALCQEDRPLSELLHGYLGIAANGESADATALRAFLAEAASFPAQTMR